MASIKMNVRKGVVVVRDGERVRPTVGEDFSFSAAERDSILAADPAALVKPDKASDSEETAAPATRTSGAEKSQAKARGSGKAATANKSDAEVAGEGEAATDAPEGGPAPAGAGTDDDL